MMQIFDSVDRLTELVLPDDPPRLLGVVKDLITLRNATEHQLAVGAAMVDRLGMAKKVGSTTSKLLQANGAPPAARWVRIGAGLAGLDRTAGYFRDGFLSTEHVDAVVKGVGHVVGRSQVGITPEERTDVERQLLSHAIAGAPPSEVEKVARGLGNQVATDTGGLPPAEDPSLNMMDYNVNSEGRMVGRVDVDAQIGEKLFSALDYWSKSRPEPDGSDDARTTTQRHADALHQLLDCGGGGQGLVSARGPRSWCRCPPITPIRLHCHGWVRPAKPPPQHWPAIRPSPPSSWTGKRCRSIWVHPSDCLAGRSVRQSSSAMPVSAGWAASEEHA